MQVQVIKSGNQTLQVKKRGFFFEEDNDACILKSYLCGWKIELTICFKIFCRTYLIFQALNTFCLSLTDHMWLFLLQKLFSSNFFFEREASFFLKCAYHSRVLERNPFHFLYKQIIHGFMKYKNMNCVLKRLCMKVLNKHGQLNETFFYWCHC